MNKRQQDISNFINDNIINNNINNLLTTYSEELNGIKKQKKHLRIELLSPKFTK